MDKNNFLNLFENLTFNNEDIYLTSLDNFIGSKLETKKNNLHKLLKTIFEQHSEHKLRLFRTDNFIAFKIIDNNIFIDKDYVSYLKEIKVFLEQFKNTFKKEQVEDYALVQRMHNVKKSFSYFIYLNENIQIPQVILLNDEILYDKHSIENFNELIIIENLECFFRYKDFITTDIFDSIPNINNCIILLGNGNQITNKKLQPFFNQFKKIHTFFDYDNAGFSFFDSINHINKINYIPKKQILLNIINKIHQINKNENKQSKYLEKIVNQAYIKIYNDTIQNQNNKKFLFIEQEILLNKEIL